MLNEKKKRTVIMSEGTIWKQLIFFSVPLLIGNIFQQLYNTVDSIVVGQYIGSEALAAVGSSNSLINLIIGMFIGIATGAGVIISQYYGARDEKKMHWAVHTCMALSIAGGLLLTIIGIVLSPVILKLMGTPDEVMSNSVTYLKIFFSGSLFNLVYNIGAGVLRAVGDSKRPLYFLCISSVINIILDFTFVVCFGMGIAGAGLATIISQAVSAALVMMVLIKSNDIYRVIPSKLRIDRIMMGRILKIGIPSGVQNSIISLSNVIVQANVNAYGAAAMAGFGAYNKIDGFVMLPLQSFCMAATTFTGQNIGAGKTKRVKQGVFQGVAISLIYTAIIDAFLYCNVDTILSFFSNDLDVIHFGKVTMTWLLPFYVTMAVHNILMGSFRGAGKTLVSMIIGVGNMCVLRMIYINLLVPMFPSYSAVMLCYPITWVTTVLMDIVYCIKAPWIPRMNKESEQ